MDISKWISVNVLGNYPEDMWKVGVGVAGKCVSKDIDIIPESNWKCVDFRIAPNLTREQIDDYYAHKKKHGYIAVCRWCRKFKEGKTHDE